VEEEGRKDRVERNERVERKEIVERRESGVGITSRKGDETPRSDSMFTQ
jgi:hypothetical protein